jgi:deoxyadenosine/deoxycytidine kinase
VAYIVVEGPIGAGKTSLARLIAAATGHRTLLELVEENPFLADFYQDKARHAFKVETFFLLSRYKQLARLEQEGAFDEGVVADYLFEKNWIFASMNLSGAEWGLFGDLYENLRPKLRTPDLIVYLRAEPALLLRRIEKRRRPFEAAMDPEYLRELGRRYDDYFESRPGNLLTVEAAEFDFVESPVDLDRILHLVAAKSGVEVSTCTLL